MILKKLLTHTLLTELELMDSLDREPERIKKIIQDLCNEQLIQCKDEKFYLA